MASRNPWGRILTEADGAPAAPTAEDFRAVGLCEADAESAARGLAQGLYLSFEDACISRSMFDPQRRNRLDESRMREVARRFAPVSSLSELEAATAARLREIAAGGQLWDGGTASTPRLVERRTPTQVRPHLVESATATAAGEGRFSVCLITAGEGSSGVYPAATLQEAARAKVFHEGVHCYLDHPTNSEDMERPERSVRDLAGCLESDATYRSGGLYGQMRVFAPYRDLLKEMAPHIGLSIRADGELSESSAGGKPTVTKITRAHSVDFVTQAGRGGRVVSAT